MRRTATILGCIYAVSTSAALASDPSFPMEATNAKGETVILYEDGTWRPKTLQLMHQVLRRSQFATAEVASKFPFYEFFYDPNVWNPDEVFGDAAHVFAHRQGEAWCSLIAERMQLSQEIMERAIGTNMQELDNARLEQKTRAFVNGVPGVVYQYSGIMEGMPLAYYNFATSGSKGTMQIACWTSANLLEEYTDVFLTFFGGFTLRG